jgi:hypothetical protein
MNSLEEAKTIHVHLQDGVEYLLNRRAAREDYKNTGSN